jgi:signal transduction histidine kinase
MCRLLGDAVSQNIERLSYTSRLQARKLINTVPTKANPSGYIVASSDDLLQLFDADYGVLCIHDETKIFGNGDGSSQEILALVEFLRIRKLNAGFASHDLIKDFPDFQYGTGLKTIAGLLFVPLSTGGNDFICLFRKGHLTEIKWAGNPYEIKKKKQTAGYLEPRNSFATWRETVLTQSREWSDSDIETAAVLCLVYGKFIKIWREKEAAMEKSHFSRLLMANSAHEARTPLNAIVNYLEIALEGSLDTETRDSLAKSHSASKSLIYVINDLLDLTQTEKGLDLIKDESFNLQTTLKEAVDMMAGEAKRKNIALTVTVDPEVPHQVLGDQRRVRQMFSNIISNAVQHTNSGAITVEMWRSTTQQSMEDHIAVDTLIVDTGLGMSNSQLEVLFQELEQVSTHEYHSPEDEQGPDSRDNEYKPVLGLGLAMVARVVNNMHGQLAVQSEEGKGSQFKLMLPFKLPEGVSVAAPFHGELPIPANSLASPPVSSPQFVLKGETRDGERDERCRSTDSLHSASSARSRRSHADRLIHAIQDPAHSQLTHGHSDMTHGTQSTKLLNSHYPSTLVASPSSSLARSASMQSHSNGLSTVKHAPPPRLQPFRTSSAPGTENITHSGVPLSAIRLSKQSINEQNQAAEQSSYFSPMPTPKSEISGPLMTGPSLTAPTSAPPAKPRCLHVLVAEDDPINSKIIEKRLTKVGHTVELTSNGEACATTFKANNLAFDVVLMDIQVSAISFFFSFVFFFINIDS